MIDANKILKLEQQARGVRREVLEMIARAGKGHIGGSFSCTDLLVALYFGPILHFDSKSPKLTDRDRFIFSKGHSAEALYAVLAKAGFMAESELQTYGKNGSKLGGHVDFCLPGVEVSTGSLGHGLGIGAGMAWAAKMGHKDFYTFVLLGDGECYEGSIWESALFAAHHELNHLVAIIDRNKQITLDVTEDCNRLEPFADKWGAFGWDVVEVNGHSYSDLLSALSNCKNRISRKPLVVIAHTLKGKGVSFMEDKPYWHHNVPKGDQLDLARRELSERYE